MQILGLLGMYFDAVVVEVKTFFLLFRLALAILCACSTDKSRRNATHKWGAGTAGTKGEIPWKCEILSNSWP